MHIPNFAKPGFMNGILRENNACVRKKWSCKVCAMCVLTLWRVLLAEYIRTSLLLWLRSPFPEIWKSGSSESIWKCAAADLCIVLHIQYSISCQKIPSSSQTFGLFRFGEIVSSWSHVWQVHQSNPAVQQGRTTLRGRSDFISDLSLADPPHRHVFILWFPPYMCHPCRLHYQVGVTNAAAPLNHGQWRDMQQICDRLDGSGWKRVKGSYEHDAWFINIQLM